MLYSSPGLDPPSPTRPPHKADQNPLIPSRKATLFHLCGVLPALTRTAVRKPQAAGASAKPFHDGLCSDGWARRVRTWSELELVAEEGDDCPGLGRYVGVRTRQVDVGGGGT
jgi:hypothetical protein